MSTLILFFHSMKLMCTKFGAERFNNEDVSLERPKKWGSDLLTTSPLREVDGKLYQIVDLEAELHCQTIASLFSRFFGFDRSVALRYIFPRQIFFAR